MLSRSEFDVMLALKKTPAASQRAIASECGMSLGAVNAVVKSLGERGLVEGGALTAEGEDELSPYKVRNAVIMAAGLSSRMAPLSYERPKGVLKVRGEVLIERQISQLKKAGIDDITVVVGFKKEEFFYLEDRFGVKIVVNTDYISRNNHATLFQVRNIIGNTYICSSDDYFMHNLFERYVYDSYYAAVFEEGDTDEYCLETQGRDMRITGAHPGGSHSWVIMGHAYWTRDFTCDFMRFLAEEYNLGETRGKLWDDIFLDHADELRMYMRPYDAGEIREFDSLYQVQDFDPLFIENVASDVLDNICATLDCARADIAGVNPIKRGLTNLSFYFECKGRAFVYRHPGAGTDEIINRRAETYALKVASELGLDSSFVYEDPERGWKISRFVPDCTPFNYADEGQVARALGLVRRLHESGAQSPWSFDFFDEATKVEGLLASEGWSFPSDFSEIKAKIERLVPLMRAGAGAPVLCHNDFYGPNILVHGDEMCLIDWEYAAMGDYGCDFGNFVAQGSGFDVARAKEAIPLYFGREGTRDEVFHLIACTAIVGWYWYVWAMHRESKSAPVGEWLYVWYRSAKDYADAALAMAEEVGMSASGAGALAHDEFVALAQAEAKMRHTVHPESIDPAAHDAACARLRERGLLAGDEPTPRGLAALEPYRARRAVLLAAGFGSRLLPVTVNTPKPLARVHGVRIIDRLIDAVMAAGIDEIYIVRGYLAEEFDQLLHKYPNLRFIDNPLYGETNNISSAVAACEHFERAYVFESDLFLTNPALVSKYQFQSNYLGFPVEKTDDWCFDANGDGVIENLAKGKDAPCWQMVGLSFWTAADGARLARDIPEVFEREDAKQIFWDDVAIVRRAGDYAVHVRECSPDDILEIDDFDDLQRIDPSYIVRHKGA